MYLSFYKKAPYVAIVNLREEKGYRLDDERYKDYSEWVEYAKDFWTYRHDFKLGVWDDKETT